MGPKRSRRKPSAAASAKNQALTEERQCPAGKEALSVVAEDEEETKHSERPITQEFNRALRKTALEDAAANLLKTGIRLLDHESLFEKVCDQKHKCRDKIGVITRGFDARQQKN